MTFILEFLQFAINIFIVLIMIRVVLSWFSPNTQNIFVKFIIDATEPFLAPFRRFASVNILDFSPFLAILILELIKSLINKLL